MINILTVIPFCKGDGALAEKLIDWMFSLNSRKKLGHCLLVPSTDCHAELITKVQISAEVAFESAMFHNDPSPTDGSKSQRINNKFMAASEHIAKHFKWPFLWLEPDCVPLKPSWLDELADAYAAQPKRYMGPILKYTNPDRICLSRVAIYPSDAVTDLGSHCKSNMPFNIAAGDGLVSMAGKSTLFQQLDYRDEADKAKIRPNAVLLHHDKKGQLASFLRRKEALTT